tara:strand:- start:129 stop:344 length:216 start_codon:yes stop_codon:yes gene_type:complete
MKLLVTYHEAGAGDTIVKFVTHPHIIDALEYARETGATVGLISNAGKFSPLTEEQADQMVEKYYAQNGAQQ